MTKDDPAPPPFAASDATARGFALFAGSFASGYDVAAASLALNRKHRAWQEGRSSLDSAATAALDARITTAEARAIDLLTSLGRAAAVPLAEEDAMIVAGRVVRGRAGQSGLTVSALDRRGKALVCADTDAGGGFSLRLERGDEVVLMVADAAKKRLLVDDRAIAVKLGETVYVELDLAKGDAGDCPNGPDLSRRRRMPDLIGLALDEARVAARREGVEIGEVVLEARPDSEGIVVRSDPEAGRLLDDDGKARLTVGRDPDAHFDRALAGAMLKAETDESVSDESVERMFAGLSEEGVTGFDKLKAAARRDDSSFAKASGLKREEAAAMRTPLVRILARFDALRDKTG